MRNFLSVAVDGSLGARLLLMLAMLACGGWSADAPPGLATPATAATNPVTRATVVLSCRGIDDGGETALIYTWTVAGSPPALVTFSANFLTPVSPNDVRKRNLK